MYFTLHPSNGLVTIVILETVTIVILGTIHPALRREWSGPRNYGQVMQCLTRSAVAADRDHIMGPECQVERAFSG